jgi:hypothetical protein
MFQTFPQKKRFFCFRISRVLAGATAIMMIAILTQIDGNWQLVFQDLGFAFRAVSIQPIRMITIVPQISLPTDQNIVLEQLLKWQPMAMSAGQTSSWVETLQEEHAGIKGGICRQIFQQGSLRPLHKRVEVILISSLKLERRDHLGGRF